MPNNGQMMNFYLDKRREIQFLYSGGDGNSCRGGLFRINYLVNCSRTRCEQKSPGLTELISYATTELHHYL